MSIIGDGIMLGAGGATASIFVTGLSETDTVTATKDGKTVIGKWTQKLNPAYVALPDGYTQLEYIESTGTQYIQVPAPTVTNGFIVEFSFYSGSQPSGYYPLFVSLGSNGFWLGWLNGSFIVRMADNKDVITTSFTTNKWIDAKVVYDGSTVKLFFDGNQVGSATATFANGGVNTYFCYDTANKTSFRLGEFEFCVGGTVIYHYVPCKNGSNSVGLYDLVTETFYGNSGTGTFTAGAEIPQYIYGFGIAPIQSYGTWTVTATDGTRTKTQDVLVDSANVFNIKITYNPNGALYWLGDECEAITGGWTNDYTFTTWSSSSYVRYQVTKEDEYMVSSAKAGYTLEGTANPIDLTNYSKVMWEIEELTITAGGGYYPGWRLCASPSRTFSTATEICNEGASSTTPGKHTYTLDVSGVSGLYYISFTNNSVVYSGRSMTAHILKIWLE